MSQEDNQDTRESPALDPNEVQFSSVDAEAVGDPAAAGTDAEGDPGSAPVEAPPAAGGFTDPGGSAEDEGDVPETSAPSGSPAAAQERASSGGDSPLERPEVQILGAFVGAFVLAKLLQWLFSRD